MFLGLCWMALSAAAAQAADAAPSARLVSQLGHSRVIFEVDFSPDGRLALTASLDGSARLWDTETGREIRALRAGPEGLRTVAFAPDGVRAATGDDAGRVVLWDVVTGRELRRLEHPDAVTAVSFVGGDRLVSACRDGVGRLWHLAGDESAVHYRGHSGEMTALAPSADGRLLLTGGRDGTARLWSLESGAEIRRLAAHENGVFGVAFSPDGARLLTGGADRLARLWDAATGRELRRLSGHTREVEAVAFSPDGRQALTGAWDATVRLWDLATSRQRASLEPESSAVYAVYAVEFSPDGRRILAAARDAARLWDVESLRLLHRLRGHASWAFRALFPAGGRFLVTARDDGVVRLWDWSTGAVTRRLEGHERRVNALDFSPDGRLAVTGSWDRTARLWDLSSGEEVGRLEGHSRQLFAVAFSPDGKTVLTGAADGTARIWRVETGDEIRRFDGLGTVYAVAFTGDGRLAITAGSGQVRLWNPATGGEIGEPDLFRGAGDESIGAVAFSADGRLLLTGSGDGAVRLWDVATGRQIRFFEGHSESVRWVAFSPDQSRVLSASWDRTARLWDRSTGAEIRRFAGHGDAVSAATISPDGRFVVTASKDGTARVWRLETGAWLASLLSRPDGRWAVVAPDGRFDTDDLEGIEGLHWVLSDDPLTPLPIEVFMRDYYEPRLLARLLAGEAMAPVRPLAGLNRVQPAVRIAEVQERPAGRLRVEVEVESRRRRMSGGEGGEVLSSGVYDLRLFRDGQLVGYAPTEPGQIELDPALRRRTIVFPEVRVPRDGRRRLELTAHAFNRDRVKSRTARRLVELTSLPAPRRGRAVVLTVGVNTFDNPEWNLAFAANDARLLASTLAARLAAAGTFRQVVTMRLIADGKDDERLATRANLRQLLLRLAGAEAESPVGASIGEVAALEPEDLFVLAIATHGARDREGKFYLFPTDIGSGSGRVITRTLLARAISTDDLWRWLRDLDAGQIVLVIDACYSAATVDQAGFKPGPMGSRGLGQLAYDKGMQILAASQADSLALESAFIRQGLLTYSLVRDGLEGRWADHRPRDGRITLDEWLHYGVLRVPELYTEILRGEVRPPGRGLEPVVIGEQCRPQPLQEPALFDFSRSQREVLLEKE